MLLVIIFLATTAAVSFAQTTNPIAEKTKRMKLYKGFVDFYWDDSTGKVWLQLNKFDTEILYQTALPAGLGSNDVGLDRGIMGTTYIVKFSRVGNKILMIEPNYDYRATSEDVAEKRAVAQSFAQSTIWGFTVAAEKAIPYWLMPPIFYCVMLYR